MHSELGRCCWVMMWWCLLPALVAQCFAAYCTCPSPPRVGKHSLHSCRELQLPSVSTASLQLLKYLIKHFQPLNYVQLTLLFSSCSPWSWCLLTWFTHNWSHSWNSCVACLALRASPPWSLWWPSGWAGSTSSMGSMKAKSGGTHRYCVSCPHPPAIERWL